MKALGEVLTLSQQYLQERRIERPRRIAEELLASLLQCKRIDLYMQYDRPLIETELTRFREWLKRAAKNEPVEYIAGTVDFFGCEIHTDSRALIPRPETEILVDYVAKCVKDHKTLWDVCTGSGCIGISLKKKFQNLEVSLSDLSPEAISLARENAQRNEVEVAFFLGDLLAPFEGKKADIIVCNPPYVSSDEYLNLDPSVRDFEPKMALVGGERGLDFYERLARDVSFYLNPGGLVFLEIGMDQGDCLQQIFGSGKWSRVERVKDWSGKDRFFFLELLP